MAKAPPPPKPLRAKILEPEGVSSNSASTAIPKTTDETDYGKNDKLPQQINPQLPTREPTVIKKETLLHRAEGRGTSGAELDTTWYDFQAIRDSLIKVLNNNPEHTLNREHILDAVTNNEQLNSRLHYHFEAKSYYIVPLIVNALDGGFTAHNHWVGLHVVTDEAGVITAIRYINPTGFEINSGLKDAIINYSNVVPQDITIGRGIQFAYLDNDNILNGNNYDCGPMLVKLLSELIVHKNILTHSLNEEQSIALGQQLRQEQSYERNEHTIFSSLLKTKNNNDTFGKTDDDAIPVLIGQVNNLAITVSSQKKVVKFLVNVPMYIHASDMEGDSSNESDDNTFTENQFNFDINDEFSLPYRTFDIREKVNKNKIKEKIIKKRVGNLSLTDLDLQLDQNKSKATVSKTQDFLNLLEDKAFETKDKDNLDNIGVSIGLNRPKSLSTRKNDNLYKQLQSKEKSIIKHNKFAFFWDIPWTNDKGKLVQMDIVKKYYKQLKKKDSDKAKKFLKINEDDESPTPPYQYIREKIKNHDNSKNLVKALKQDGNALVYFSIIDSDTKSFNGIYSAYLRITGNLLPTVMSTGYEFSGDKTDHPFQVASNVDRMIRVITVRHIKLGVYYPEPNTCVLIPEEYDTLPESFIDQSRKKKDLESASLLRKIKCRENVTCVFSEDKPIITTTPVRAKRTKVRKTPISFSSELTHGASPTKKDIRLFKQISQSHFHEKVWYDNLFINGTIEVTGCTLAHCKSLLAKIRNGNDTEKNQSILKLKGHINPEVVDAIAKAAIEINRYVENFEIGYIRSENETKLLKVLEELDIKNFSPDAILILAQDEIIKMIEDELIDPKDLVDLPLKELEALFYSDESIEMLQDGSVVLEDLLNLYRITTQNFKKEFSEVLQEFQTAVENGEYSVSDILERYKNHHLHY
nr:uncharacterized protein LOC124819299 [Hydra vulgaris]